jgi:hypothetical protein
MTLRVDPEQLNSLAAQIDSFRSQTETGIQGILAASADLDSTWLDNRRAMATAKLSEAQGTIAHALGQLDEVAGLLNGRADWARGEGG